MKADVALAKLAAEAGIFAEFVDMQGATRVAGPDTQRALLCGLGIGATTPGDVQDSLARFAAKRTDRYSPQDVVVQAGRPETVPVARSVEFSLVSETDGSILSEGRAEAQIALPALPDGVHRLHLMGVSGTQEVNLIAAPRSTPNIENVLGRSRIWGGMAALYGLKTEDDKTLGDYEDLAALARVFGAASADFLGINPVHALGYAATETFSPYSPTHRGFLNTDHLSFRGAASDLTDPRYVDYIAHREEQRVRLRAAYEAFVENGDQNRFEAFCAREGAALDSFAQFEVTSTRFGPDWRTWPGDVADVQLPPSEIAYHKWLQWQADAQLAAAQASAREGGLGLGLYLDLAVGARRGGAESWSDAAPVAEGVSLGAPPDHLSPAGQNWDLSAYAPGKLQAHRYNAFRQVLRQVMRHAGLIRIDHALGLNRSYWIPDDGSPGGYVHQPFQALMAIVRIEAARASCLVVGEDLGLVPPGFRSEMAASGFYGYSVLQYEKNAKGAYKPMSKLREQSLACFGTHDTPTLAGFWSGRDVAWWERLGWTTEAEAAKAADRRTEDKRVLIDVAAPQPLPGRATDGVRDTIHAKLAGAPAALVAVQLDDILGVVEAQNLPGTVSEHPNWQRRYPSSICEFEQSAGLRATARIMARAGRTNEKQKDQT